MLVSNNDILTILGQKIKKARSKKGYTQEYVAEHINISTDLLRNIENGRNVGSVATLLNICNILEITPNDLFFELIQVNHKKKNNIDLTLMNYFSELSNKDKDIFKKIIIHIDKNY